MTTGSYMFIRSLSSSIIFPAGGSGTDLRIDTNHGIMIYFDGSKWISYLYY